MMLGNIEVGGRPVGDGQPCFVIAEAGVNHNGDLALARELVSAAKEAGADAVKFQTFKADRVITADAPKAAYQLKTTNTAESQTEMLKRLEMSEEWHFDLAAECRNRGLPFLSTAYSFEDIDFLESIDVPAFKLASIHCAEPFFVAYAARKKRPLILSTGMATIAEVDAAVRAARDAGNAQLLLLQCTTDYPSRTEEANLRTIATMRSTFGVPVGYSDHTQTLTACIAAVALGACMIEKHLTLDRNMKGPDHAASFDPREFSDLVSAVRETELALGSGLKEPSAAERENMRTMRRSLASRRDLKAGETLTEDMVALLRPATGLKPALLSELLGCRLAHDVPRGILLALSDLIG